MSIFTPVRRIIQDAFGTPFDPTNDPDCGLTAETTQEAIEEVCAKVSQSASPGYSLGRSGNTPQETWLLRPGGVPSNKTGLPVSLTGAAIVAMNIGNEDITTFDVSVYEHEGDEVNLTLLGTVSVVSARTGTFTVNWNVTTGRQIAAKISSGSAKNPGVDIQLSGTAP